MTTTLNQIRLLTQLANLVALEAAIEQRLNDLIPTTSSHAIAGALFEEFRALSRDHRRALETRLNTLKGGARPSGVQAAIYAANNSPDAAKYPVSSALLEVFTLYNQALIGYALLGSLASRELDSSCLADEGTSHHLAVRHAGEYVQALQEVSRLINDIVLLELDRDGVECQCCCLSCSAGICLCAVWWRDVLSEAWAKAGPINNGIGIYVQQPKQGSAAIQAGLARGDVILAVKGDEIESSGDIQSALRNCPPGGAIQLTVRRQSGELDEIALVQPSRK